jgi:hypothetical protein
MQQHAGSYRDADWSSVGMLPQASADKAARLLVFTGRTGRWKGIFSLHSWVVFKPEDATSWNRYDVVGISSIIVNVGKVREMCRIVRRLSPKSTIVVGGHVAAIPGIEKIIDASGTYTAPSPNPSVFTLTTGPDTFVGGPEDDTVNGTAATLNPGDQLTGGGGNDVLALYGSGFFRVDQLAVFSGFSTITLNNFTGGYATLFLGSQAITVTGLGSGVENLYLGAGQTTYQGGAGSNQIFSFSNSNWNSADVINVGSYGYLYLNWNGDANVTYDLTGDTLTSISYLNGYGDNLTLKINSTDASGVWNFASSGNRVGDLEPFLNCCLLL